MTAITLDMTGRVFSIRRQGDAEQLLIELRPGEADQIAAAARAALPDHPTQERSHASKPPRLPQPVRHV